LQQDACAIAEQWVISGGAAVFEFLENLQALRNNQMAFMVFDMRYKTDAASIMLLCGVVKSLALGEYHRVIPRKCSR
jgi:hypothetical protein